MGCSSVGRASALQVEGREFEPPLLNLKKMDNMFSRELQEDSMNNPVADYAKIIEHCSNRIRNYLETNEKKAFQKMGIAFNSLTKMLDKAGVYKFKRSPRPNVVQNAKAQHILIFYSDDIGNVLTPFYRIKYQHTPKGLKLNHEYDTKILDIEDFKKESILQNKIQVFDENSKPISL
jgi:hypothetical protein